MIALLRPVLGTTESLFSYTSRLAAINGAENMRQFLTHMEIPEGWIINCQNEGVTRIAALGRINAKAIERHSIIRNGEDFRLNGQVLSRSLLRRTHLRACLECLQEDIVMNPGPTEARPYCRSTWLLSSIYCCDKHGKPLFELPQCPEGVSIYDFSRRVEPLLPEFAKLITGLRPSVPTSYERYVTNRVYGLKQTWTWLDSLPLFAADGVVNNVGAVSVYGSEVEYEKLSEDERRLAADRGFEVARDGANGFENLFLELRSRFFGTRYDWGPRDVYGRLYEWLAHETDNAVYDPLRKVMFDFTQVNFPVGPSHSMFNKPFPTRVLHSIRSASVETGLHPKRLRKLLLKSGLWNESDSDLTDDRILFSAEAAESVLAKLIASLKLNEIEPYLNIPRAQLGALRKAGFLEPDMSFDTRSGKARAFSRQKIDAFMEALSAGATPVRQISDRLLQIPTGAKRACCSAGEIVKLILDGRLQRKGILTTEKGYMSILVDPEEIKPLVRGEEHGGVSLREAEKQLGVSSRVLVALMDHGYLPAIEVINPTNRCPQRVVDQDNINAFRETYVSLSALGDELGAYLGDLKQRLAEAGIEPFMKPDLVHATFYRRSDVGDI